jgi:hypothetical protein
MTLAKLGPFATVLAIFWIGCTSVRAATITVRAIAADGEGVSKVLVIVRAPSNPGYEVLRALTEADGSVPEVNVQPGLYEAIATDPYGEWLTAVKDFVVTDAPVKLDLRLDFVQDQSISLGFIDWNVRVVDKQGRPVNDAWITARTEGEPAVGATATDINGHATIEIPFDYPAIVTVLYNGQTYTERIKVDASVRDSENKWFQRERNKLVKRPRAITVSVD